MIERLKICLVHPKFMGKYVIEKTWKVVLLLLVLILINIFTIFGLTYSEAYLSQNEENGLMNAILMEEDLDLQLRDNKLSSASGKSFSFTALDVDLVFFADIDFESKSLYKIAFKEMNCELYVSNYKMATMNYDGLNDFDFTNDNLPNRTNLLSLIRGCFLELRPTIASMQSISIIVDMLMSILMLALLIALLGYPLNPGVRGIFRFRLILHSFISYLVVYWFYLVFSSSLLYYIAFGLPYIYFFIAIKNILKIDARG